MIVDVPTNANVGQSRPQPANFSLNQLNTNLGTLAIDGNGMSENFNDRSNAGVASPIPNSNIEVSYFGANVGANVNASPSKRSNFNLFSTDFGECSSSNSSPVHYSHIANKIIGKTNNTSSPQHPIRPSRTKKSVSPPGT